MIIKDLPPETLDLALVLGIFAKPMAVQHDLTSTLKKSLQKLLLKKYREQEGKFIVEGPHLVEEVLTSSWVVDVVIATPLFRSNPHAPEILKRAANQGVKIAETSDAFFKKITDTVTSQGIAAVVRASKSNVRDIWREDARDAIVAALDGINDPGNVGTIIRTCDWFGVDAVLLGKGTADLFNPKTLRATMGSMFHLPIYFDVDLMAEISSAKKTGFRVVAAVSSGGKGLGKKLVSRKNLIILGNEAHGIHQSLQQMADDEVTIPRFGSAESLNVAISAGIILSWLRM